MIGYFALFLYVAALVAGSIEMILFPQSYKKRELQFFSHHKIVTTFDRMLYIVGFVSLALLIVHVVLEPVSISFLVAYVVIPITVLAGPIIYLVPSWSKAMYKYTQKQTKHAFFVGGIARLILAVLMLIPLLLP